ncbi:transcriptional regulator, y4mF family [Parasphingorhabdus marina DSM 22363]|uniref:Transcriptional regulator, y4mF family n=1 Tax=Parasphingorhabdus marina DSM 22363 TaxID=1123272 RepID=A0A1N6EJJ5_9SPHN|nr:helix-turn-helix transcriptional regulator [Parasphingorhabdus marina]SIN83184.1 transcriptional regulator, y4mF family [Parasphingorhabdus marina DSM 22363]
MSDFDSPSNRLRKAMGGLPSHRSPAEKALNEIAELRIHNETIQNEIEKILAPLGSTRLSNLARGLSESDHFDKTVGKLGEIEDLKKRAGLTYRDQEIAEKLAHALPTTLPAAQSDVDGIYKNGYKSGQEFAQRKLDNFHFNNVGELGKRIRTARKAMKLNQQQFADTAGVGRRFVSELENGKESLEIGLVLACCAAAGIDLFAKPRNN